MDAEECWSEAAEKAHHRSENVTDTGGVTENTNRECDIQTCKCQAQWAIEQSGNTQNSPFLCDPQADCLVAHAAERNSLQYYSPLIEGGTLQPGITRCASICLRARC